MDEHESAGSVAGETTTRLERAAERARDATGRARDALERTKDGMVAGASGLAEITRTVATETADRAGRVVEFVREAETDAGLREKVLHTTERTLHQAGDRLSGAAPLIGRGTEAAVRGVGKALHLVAHPLAVVIGAIAGTVGGWWKQAASDSSAEWPETEEQACRAHFVTVVGIPAETTFERARTGYSLGYLAGRNPEYRGRSFDDIEADLRQGFTGEHADEYDALREFARYGYGRGMGGAL
jgi:hypothetical protein